MSVGSSNAHFGGKTGKVKKFCKMVSVAHIPELKEKFRTEEVPMNDKGELIENKDDEFVLPIDEEGETKVDTDGNLLGGREYKFKTFTLKTRNNKNKRYALAAEMSKLLDYKRGALLFVNHKYTLFKCYLTESEKEMLKEESDVLDNISSLNLHKAVLIVPARSLFREFGYKCVKNGVPVQDDYYVSVAPYPEYPENVSSVSSLKIYEHLKPYVKDPSVDVYPPSRSSDMSAFSSASLQQNQQQSLYNDRNVKSSNTNLSQSFSGSNLARQGDQFYSRGSTNNQESIELSNGPNSNPGSNNNSVTRSQLLYSPHVQYIREGSCKRVVDMFDMMQSNLNISLNAKMTKENWIFMHAEACSRLNYDLYENRERWQFVKNRGVRDPYTNSLHVPKFTQPTRILSRNKVFKKSKDDKKCSGINIELLFKDDNVHTVRTGLSTLPGLENLVKTIKDKEILDAIQQQIQYEENN